MRLTSLLVLGLSASASAGVDFVREIRPIFEQHCAKCHGAEKQKSGFRLDVKQAALTQGDSHAPNIVPGDGAHSPLVRFVNGEDEDMLMPPKGERLSKTQVDLLRTWIDEGAVWPEGADTVKLKDKADHWAFRAVQRPELPAVQHAGWARNGIDRFILAKLEQAGIEPAAEADRVTWLRRVYFTLIGLPPTPEEIAAFSADPRSDAYERVVDRLLASPRYGERWARHWLDVIAFGETHGFEVNTPRPNAWPYRDYVIRALNTDKPYPEFIKDQLAGDTTNEDTATGFIVAAAALLPGQIGKDPESKALARQDELNSMVLGASTAFLGLTVNCARCHDHKFDPISQRDYYAMQAVFAGVHHGERPQRDASEAERVRIVTETLAKLAELRPKLAAYEPLADPDSQGPRRPAVQATGNVERFAPVTTRRVRFSIRETNSLPPCLDELEIYSAEKTPRNVALASAGAKASGSTNQRIEGLIDGRYGNNHSWLARENGEQRVEIEFPEAVTIDQIAWSRDREGKFTDRLATQYRFEVSAADGTWQTVAASSDRAKYVSDKKADFAKTLPVDERPNYYYLVAQEKELLTQLKASAEGPMVYAGKFEAPEEIHRLNRGDPTQPKEAVEPGAIARLLPAFECKTDSPEQERRLALARWIGDARNPLTARVLVNRLWHFHFGEGIVSTPSDFGNNGARPTHPELLDWLASEFVTQGWSLKAMHRLICLSATYRQASRWSPAFASTGAVNPTTVDAGDRLLWRFPPHRLEAEAIRDTLLDVCGTLDLRMGGPGYSAFAPNDNYVRVYDPKQDYGPKEWRRMIYQTKVRMAQDSTFGAFDCPDAGLPQPRRARSTTPLQALSLFNSAFVQQQTGLFAERLQREAGADPARQIERAFVLALGRKPEASESEWCAQLIHEQGLPSFCRVVVNLNEFLFIP